MSTSNLTLVRAVDVDDDDEQLVFSGPWTIHKDDFEEYPVYGPVYRGSQHRLLNATGTVTFRFNGTGKVGIYGTSNARNKSGIFDPSNSCMRNGLYFPGDKPRRAPINGWPLCYIAGNSKRQHVLTLTGVSSNTALYVDKIVYEPDYASPPEAPTVRIKSNDLAVEYLEGGWTTSMQAVGMLTEHAGAKMRITFTGSSATFIGGIAPDYPGGNSTATYSLNGNSPTVFVVPGSPSDGSTVYEQPFFQIKDLGPETHELVVTHNGPPAPLVFNYLRVEDGDIYQFAAIREPEPDGKKAPLGAIVGGAIGGAILVLALIAFIVITRKRKQKREAETIAAAVVDPSRFPAQPPPLSAKYEIAPLVLSDDPLPPSFQSAGKGSSSTRDYIADGPGNHDTPSVSTDLSGHVRRSSTNTPPPYIISPLVLATKTASDEKSAQI
ncbi:hypothetical protein BKA70DRAFT_1520700 [Coprinopsis sp. MPI-PUGE-AT-0042]|nr:hypothetical protein BKA70DRAFT_1520700 [Coprinopsis sp. MPI-PUGE-AT-0042]